jgi:hypothetical protein
MFKLFLPVRRCIRIRCPCLCRAFLPPPRASFSSGLVHGETVSAAGPQALPGLAVACGFLGAYPSRLPVFGACSVSGLIHGSAVPPPANAGLAVACGFLGAYPSTLPVLCASPASGLLHGETVSAMGPQGKSGFAAACGCVGAWPSTLAALCTSSAPPSDSRVSPGRPVAPGGSLSPEFPRPGVPSWTSRRASIRTSIFRRGHPPDNGSRRKPANSVVVPTPDSEHGHGPRIVPCVRSSPSARSAIGPVEHTRVVGIRDWSGRRRSAEINDGGNGSVHDTGPESRRPLHLGGRPDGRNAGAHRSGSRRLPVLPLCIVRTDSPGACYRRTHQGAEYDGWGHPYANLGADTRLGGAREPHSGGQPCRSLLGFPMDVARSARRALG